jgi:SPP1 gp7 family putative phage head morphogenesis protein
MKSKAYWVKRAVEVETYLQSQADSIKDGVIKAYERAIKNVNNDIEKTFKAYISTDIPEKEARRLMSIADSDKQYEELLELYDETDDKTVKKEILNRINAQSYGARISRLEGLKRNVYIYFRHVANEAIKEQKKLYDSAVKTAYYTNIFDTAKGLNCGIDFSLVPQRAVNMVLSEPWHGHNYSERIWIHNDRFIQAVGQTIEDGIISGHSVSRMTDKLIDYVKDTAPGGIRTSAETLVRSETAHFMNQGQRMAYEEIGIKQYRFVAALSELTCDTCGNLDGSVFDTDKAVEGENFPPIHPRCRCVTVMADVNLSSRIARDPLTGENYKVDGNMTFNEWKSGLTDEQRNALKYVANAEKRGIIKARSGSVALENQRYGRNKVTLVNKTYIESGEYKRKFDNISENKAVNKTLYDCAKAALKHRSGTKFEDMYWIDGNTGEIIASALNEKETSGVAKSKRRNKVLARYGNIYAIHSHPASMPPSATDFNCFFEQGYSKAFVACHDGTLYSYTSEQEVSIELYNLYVSKFASNGYSEKEAQLKALAKLKENHKIDFWEVV